MMDLRIENPKTTEAYAASLSGLAHPPPWTMHPNEPGSLIDANGNEVLVIDHDRGRSDFDVLQIAAWVMCAVNTCAGFVATPQGEWGRIATPAGKGAEART